jgi:hypothetical protein
MFPKDSPAIGAGDLLRLLLCGLSFHIYGLCLYSRTIYLLLLLKTIQLLLSGSNFIKLILSETTFSAINLDSNA